MPHKISASQRIIRPIRLGLFAIFAAILSYLAVNCILAWNYIDRFTRPGCQETPAYLENLPKPIETILLSDDGTRLRGWYYPSRNGVALIALGGPIGSLGTRLPPIDFLVRAGYGVLQIDSRACARPAARVTLGANEVLDAQAGLNFLLSRPEVEHIAAIGFSMGGATAIRLAARQTEIEAVIAEGGYFNLGDDITEPGQPKSIPMSVLLHTIAWVYRWQTGFDPWQVSPVDDLPQISPRAVFLIYGEKEIESGRAQLQFAAAKEPKELWIVVGGDHGKNYLAAREEYEQRILKFLEPLLR